MTDLPPLDDDLREYLDAEREIEAPPANARQQLFAGLASALPLAPASPTGVETAPLDATASAGLGSQGLATAGAAAAGSLKGKIALAAVAALLGAGGGAATQAYIGSAGPTLQPVERDPVPVLLSVTIVSEPPPPTTAADEAPSASAPPSPAPPQHSASSLRAERLLLESASAALMRGDPVSAQSALQEHARRFPNGALAPEREVLRAQASRAAGKPQGAKPE